MQISNKVVKMKEKEETPNETKKTNWVELRKTRIYTVSSHVSSILRQFILAGIGIVWLFKVTDTSGKISIDNLLLYALVSFVFSILVEFLHYIIELIFNAFYLLEKYKTEEMPTYLSGISWVLWIVKIVLVLFAYVEIGLFLYGKICC